MTLEELLQTAIAAVTDAARACRRVQADIALDPLTKGDRSPVTIADFAAQAIVSLRLAAADGSIPLVGEEDAAALRTAEGAGRRERVRAVVEAVTGVGDVEAILGAADPESSLVFHQLARLAGDPRPVLAGVDMIQAVRAWPGRLAAVVGAADIFAGPKSVAPLAEPGHIGLRQVFVVEEGAHVDVTVGHHVEDTTAALWTFLSVDGGPAAEPG